MTNIKLHIITKNSFYLKHFILKKYLKLFNELTYSINPLPPKNRRRSYMLFMTIFLNYAIETAEALFSVN